MKSLSKFNLVCFVALIALTFVLIGLTNHYVLTVDFYQSSGNPLSGVPGKELAIYENMKKWIYFSAFVYVLVKIIVVSLLLYTGFVLTGHEISMNSIIRPVILCEYLFLLPAIFKLLWFQWYYPAGTLSDWHRLYVLSALSLFDTVPNDWYYALQTLNIFEVSYWFLLALGLGGSIKISFDSALRVVMVSYLPALFIWVSFVSFCTIMLFPGTA